MRRVWYKNPGDTNPTIITGEDSFRPDEYFFLADCGENAKAYSIGWEGETPHILTRAEWELEEGKRILEENLLKIDQEVKEADEQPFEFNGHTFYPDTEFIQGIFSVLPLLPSNYTEVWKTADKENDGVNNVYVTLDKAGIQGLALAYLQFKKDNWKAGEIRKQTLKNQFLGGA